MGTVAPLACAIGRALSPPYGNAHRSDVPILLRRRSAARTHDRAQPIGGLTNQIAAERPKGRLAAHLSFGTAMKKSELTRERLRELLDYDPKTGEFRWRNNSKHRAGRIAGFHQRSVSWCINIDGRRYQAHQLAWLYVKGEWGRPVIDHRDGNPLNNRWSNLRLSTYSGNAANRGRMRSNTSGFKGAVFDPRTGKWLALISKEGRRYCLGRYPTAEEAHEAYVAKARELFGDFARVK